MKIIIRCCGERTEKKCIQIAKSEGEIHIVKTSPFGESMRQAYKIAIDLNQAWTPMVDADVLLYPGSLKKALTELNGMLHSDGIFCLDGKTRDKIMMKKRRAGIHIYNTKLLKKALPHIDNYELKPETFVRKKMALKGFKTHKSKIIFGIHDYEQYYKDLWRKAVCQTQKLRKMIRNKPTIWKRLAQTDKDYLVIYHAHLYGKKIKTNVLIDSRIDYGATQGLKKLRIKEKARLI
jgi:hypothetical protein